MKFDEIMQEIGESGRAQYFLTVLISPAFMIAAATVYTQLFMQGDDNYRCKITNCENSSSAAAFDVDWLNSTIPYEFDVKLEKSILSRCRMYDYNFTSAQCALDKFQTSSVIDCQEWTFLTPHKTLIKEWNLTCNNRWKLTTAMSIFMAGFLIGVFVFGMISDRYGRRTSVLICVVILIVSCFANIFSPNLLVYGLCRFFIGASGIGLLTNTFVLLTEYTGPNNRNYCSLVLMAWQFGEYILNGLAYTLRDWRHLQISMCICSLFFLIYFWLLPESARWLISHNRPEEAKKYLKTFARWQRRDIDDEMLKFDEISEDVPSCSPLTLFRTPEIRKRIIIISIIWFIDSIVSYNIALGAKNLPGNLHTNFACITTAALIGTLSGLVGIKYVKRRVLMSVCFVIVAVSSFSTSILNPDSDMQNVAVAMVGKVTIVVCFNVTYLYTAELFPTPIRSVAMGTGSMCSRIGGVLAPFVVLSVYVWRLLPWMIAGSVCMLASLLVWFIPETFGRELPSTIEEVENQGKEQTFFLKFIKTGKQEEKKIEAGITEND